MSKIKSKSKEELVAIIKEARERSKHRFLLFINSLKIKSGSKSTIFLKVMAKFQKELFEDIESSIKAVAEGNKPPCQRWWIERTKKASKDADIAAMLLWLVAFPKRPLYIQVGAADKDQAGIVRDRISDLLHFNPWLNEYVEIVKWEVRSKTEKKDGSPMAVIDILAADIAGSHGATPDLLVVNELSHVNKARWQFIQNLMDNADGVPDGVVIVATNAGEKNTPQWTWRENAIKSPRWKTYWWDKPAPWHTKETVADAKKRNPLARFKRLWQGKWSSGKGDGLPDELIEQAFQHNIEPILSKEPGWLYVAGLDLGINHDHAALMVLGIHAGLNIIKSAYWQAWKPTRKQGRTKPEVDLIEVEQITFEMSRLFGVVCLIYDPYQAKLISQLLIKRGVATKEMNFSSPKNQCLMANSLIETLESGTLQLYDDTEQRLRADLFKFSVVERQYGVRLEAVRDESGHADVGTALAIALPAAVELLRGSRGLSPDDDLTAKIDEELTKEEIESMPEALREIFEMHDDDWRRPGIY